MYIPKYPDTKISCISFAKLRENPPLFYSVRLLVMLDDIGYIQTNTLSPPRSNQNWALTC